MGSYKIDDLDREIIHRLSQDARMSNRKIATDLGFTEGTIRTRVRRLEDESYIRFTVVTNTAHLRRSQIAHIGVHAEQGDIQVVADKIAEMPEINVVAILLGRFDIMAIGIFEGLDAVHHTASNEILALPGVRLVETSLIVNVTKYDHRIAKILPPIVETNPDPRT